MILYHFIKSITFYKVRSQLWLLVKFSIFCDESIFTPCKSSSWHIQNMLFIIDPGRHLNKGSILMGHSFLFIFHFASICGEYIWCNISTKHWILNSYFRQTFKKKFNSQLVHLYLTLYNDITKFITTRIYMHIWKVAKIMCWNGLHKLFWNSMLVKMWLKYTLYSRFPFP